jgi:hypothetical protein
MIANACDPNFGGMGCGSCPEDERVPIHVDTIVPYQPGDIIRFVSSNYDTIEFFCTSRTYFQEIEQPQGDQEIACCDEYEVEGFECKFENSQMYI